MKKQFLTLAALFLALTGVALSASSAHAVDLVPATFKDFYLQSRITHYDRNATDNSECLPSSPLAGGGAGSSGTPGSIPVVGSNNVESAYNYFISRGLQDYQAAAIVGNLIAESNVNPSALNSIGAYGIAQWLGGRKTNLQSKADYGTLQVQLDFIWEELSGPYSGVLSSLRASSDIGQATRIILERYEIPCMPGPQCNPEYNKRLPMAQGVLQQYGGTSPTTPAPTDPAETPAAQASTSSCPVPQPTVSPGGTGGSAVGSPSAPTTGNQPGNYADPNQACPTGTTDAGIVTTTYSGPLVSTPYPTIRLCTLSSILGSPRMNAAVAAQFQQMGEAARAAGRTLTATSSFRANDSCGGSGSNGCASPGQSNHQLGIAIDFALTDGRKGNQNGPRGCEYRITSNDPRWIWMRDNAPGYGIRQLDYENWHWDTEVSRTRC